MAGFSFAGVWGAQPFTDANGDVIAGNLTVYVDSGHSTVATLYTDQTMATTGPNPVSPDSFGNITFFAYPGVYYGVFAYGNSTVNLTMPVQPWPQDLLQGIAGPPGPPGPTGSPGVPSLDTNAADIQPIGTQAAGSTGKAADAGHVHGNFGNSTDPQPLGTTAAGSSGRVADAQHVHHYNPGIAGAISSSTPGDTAAAGGWGSLADAAHRHARVDGYGTSTTTMAYGTLTAQGSSANLARSDHVHGLANLNTVAGFVNPVFSPASAGASGVAADAAHVHPTTFASSQLSADSSTLTAATGNSILTLSLGVGTWKVDYSLVYTIATTLGVMDTYLTFSGTATIVGGSASTKPSATATPANNASMAMVTVTVAGTLTLNAYPASGTAGAVARANTQGGSAKGGATAIVARQC